LLLSGPSPRSRGRSTRRFRQVTARDLHSAPDLLIGNQHLDPYRAPRQAHKTRHDHR